MGESPFQPCCPCGVQCCECHARPTQVIVKVVSGGWANNNCTNCTAVDGEFTLGLSTDGPGGAVCFWDYCEDSYCVREDCAEGLGDEDGYKFEVTALITNSGDTCTYRVTLDIGMQPFEANGCFGSTVPHDEECDDPGESGSFWEGTVAFDTSNEECADEEFHTLTPGTFADEHIDTDGSAGGNSACSGTLGTVQIKLVF